MHIAMKHLHPTFPHIDYRFVRRSVGIIVWRGLTLSLLYISMFALLMLIQPDVLTVLDSAVLPHMLRSLRIEFAQLGIADDQLILSLALVPVVIQIMGAMQLWDDTPDMLTADQLVLMRMCMAAGWLVDFDGDSYRLYGPEGQRETRYHLVDLADFAADEDTP